MDFGFLNYERFIIIYFIQKAENYAINKRNTDQLEVNILEDAVLFLVYIFDFHRGKGN